MLSLLIENGLSVTVGDASGSTPLHLACERGDPDVVQLLVANGAETFATENDGLTPLDIAVSCEHLDVVRLLATHDHVVDSVAQDGRTFLHRAVLSKNISIIEAILSVNVAIDAIDVRGHTALAYAVDAAMVDVVQWLLDKHADPNVLAPVKTESGEVLPEEEAVLHTALRRQNHEMIAMLMSCKRINLNTRDSLGRTPLMVAVAAGLSDVVTTIVVAACADVNLEDKQGVSALLLATERNDETAVQLLLEHGARAVSSTGRTAVSMAKSPEVRAALLSHSSCHYNTQCLTLLSSPPTSTTNDLAEIDELVPWISSVYDLRFILTVVSRTSAVADREKLLKKAFEHVVACKFVFKDEDWVFFTTILEHCENNKWLSHEDKLSLQRKAEKANNESAGWVQALKQQVATNTWRLEAQDQCLQTVVSGIKDLHTIVPENREAVDAVGINVGLLQQHVENGYKMIAELRAHTHHLTNHLEDVQQRLTQGENNIRSLVSSLQTFRDAYVSRLTHEEHTKRIKRVCGLVAAVAGVFAPVLKEGLNMLVDYTNPAEIFRHMYEGGDVVRFLTDTSTARLKPLFQEQLEKFAIPVDEFETLLREGIAWEHPKYLDDIADELWTEQAHVDKILADLHAKVDEINQLKEEETRPTSSMMEPEPMPAIEESDNQQDELLQPPSVDSSKTDESDTDEDFDEPIPNDDEFEPAVAPECEEDLVESNETKEESESPQEAECDGDIGISESLLGLLDLLSEKMWLWLCLLVMWLWKALVFVIGSYIAHKWTV